MDPQVFSHLENPNPGRKENKENKYLRSSETFSRKQGLPTRKKKATVSWPPTVPTVPFKAGMVQRKCSVMLNIVINIILYISSLIFPSSSSSGKFFFF